VLRDIDGGRLRRVVFAGEVMPKPVLVSLAQSVPAGCELFNFYGPTETNVCLWHKVNRDDLESPDPLPIGRPIAGTEVWLQDERGARIEEQGWIGEIWVSGACVTPGYWKRPDDPNSVQHRLGRHATGDYGSWRDGCVHFHGRKDRLIKMNGFRVELGEIEAALLRHPEVAEVAVFDLRQGDDIRLCAAYVLRSDAADPGVLGIKAHCASLLPGYMIPQRPVRLAAMPRNANGKTDLRRVRGLVGEALS
jgi:acyl-coenzyme A synthetase/AMP-(fatty) acid ligase